MSGLTEDILPLCLTALIMLFVFNFLYMKKASFLFTYLKEFHPKIWQELGQPTPIGNNSPTCQMKLFHYLRDKKFENVGDPEMIRLCRGMRSLLTFGATGVAVMFVGLIFIAAGGMTASTK